MKEFIKFIVLGILLVFAVSLIAFMFQNWTIKVEDPRVTEAKAV